jgi:hypothetical protein
MSIPVQQVTGWKGEDGVIYADKAEAVLHNAHVTAMDQLHDVFRETALRCGFLNFELFFKFRTKLVEILDSEEAKLLEAEWSRSERT